MDKPPDPPPDKGVPAWVMTFADLMTLLMCFFVLLLAFSEMDVQKFKQLSGSMKEAFGVQTEVKVKSIPKGTSLIAQEFSPGKPEPTALNQVRQFTIDSNRNTLDALNREIAETREHAKKLRLALRDEIAKGAVAIETDGKKIIIRILENASFDSGKADVKPQFKPVLAKITALLDNAFGEITISGHTDNVPISNDEYSSNWDLSTNRAVRVAHELLGKARINEKRITVTGHADTRPVAPNDTPENRAKNRRVDISIVRGSQLDTQETMGVDDASGELPSADNQAPGEVEEDQV
ncbi:MAG: type VI secretion system protein TssL, long form [Woeseiaceae bacterium]|nr:type VI secretion system protein TssL, long form [Woeseiaceae bacterium]